MRGQQQSGMRRLNGHWQSGGTHPQPPVPSWKKVWGYPGHIEEKNLYLSYNFNGEFDDSPGVNDWVKRGATYPYYSQNTGAVFHFAVPRADAPDEGGGNYVFRCSAGTELRVTLDLNVLWENDIAYSQNYLEVPMYSPAPRLMAICRNELVQSGGYNGLHLFNPQAEQYSRYIHDKAVMCPIQGEGQGFANFVYELTQNYSIYGSYDAQTDNVIFTFAPNGIDAIITYFRDTDTSYGANLPDAIPLGQAIAQGMYSLSGTSFLGYYTDVGGQSGISLWEYR